MLNIVYCYGFVKDNNLILILTCRNKLVSNYVSKDSVIIDQDFKALKNVPMCVKQRINAINRFDPDAIMGCSSEITYVEHTLKKFYLSGNTLHEFTST